MEAELKAEGHATSLVCRITSEGGGEPGSSLVLGYPQEVCGLLYQRDEADVPLYRLVRAGTPCMCGAAVGWRGVAGVVAHLHATTCGCGRSACTARGPDMMITLSPNTCAAAHVGQGHRGYSGMGEISEARPLP